MLFVFIADLNGSHSARTQALSDIQHHGAQAGWQGGSVGGGMPLDASIERVLMVCMGHGFHQTPHLGALVPRRSDDMPPPRVPAPILNRPPNSAHESASAGHPASGAAWPTTMAPAGWRTPLRAVCCTRL